MLPHLSNEELQKIQLEIENMTFDFDEASMFKTVPNLIRLLIGFNETTSISDLEILRSCKLDKEDMNLLFEFGQYTLEVLIIHVLSKVHKKMRI